MVLDISKVDAIDAGGLGALLTMREHVWSRGHSLSLANARGPIKTTLETASFDSLFEIR